MGLESESSTNGEVMPDAGKNLEEATAEQGKVLEPKTETRIEAGTSSW
jgi:hypothetical protein